MRAAMIMIMALGGCSMPADAGDSAKATGKGSERSYQVSQFDSVSLGGSHDVTVKVGGAPSVVAKGDSELLDRLEIQVVGRELKIRTKRGNWSWKDVKGRTPVTIFVTTPTLAAASLGGSGDMRIDRVKGSKFNASLAGSGNMEVGRIEAGQADFSIAGSGDIKAAGKVERSTISIAGSGNADLSGLDSRTASVSVAGSGDVRGRATETANVSVLGSGDVTLSGSPKCKISKLGSGDVHCQA